MGGHAKNTDVLILNDNNQLAATGEEGELCVRGTSLAMGYYNNPEKTGAVFVQNPLNASYPEIIYRTGDIALVNERGEIMFRGRKDTLLKHSGYRIELTEIEHVIINTLGIVEKTVVLFMIMIKRKLYFATKLSKIYLFADMRKAIGSVLPKYMIPTVYHRVDEMPRNQKWKDRPT